MAISSPGVGSGLDVNSIVTQLVTLERKPIANIQSQISTLQSSISAWAQIKSGLAKLQDAAGKLASSGTWSALSASSSAADVVTVSAGAGAVAGQYQVEVQALAQAQSTRTQAFTAGSAVGEGGTLEIRLGQWSGGTFTPGGGASVSVAINATDTLSTVAQKINAANAGVRAAVVRSGGEERLVVRSADTGAANGFDIRAFDGSNNLITDTGTGLGRLAFFDDNSGGPVGQTLVTGAQDAQATVEGIAVTSASNRFEGVLSGVTFTALRTTTQPVTLTVADDTESMRKAVEEFRAAFNELSTTIKNLTRSDPTGAGNGPLRGDSAALGILTMLRRYAGDMVPGNTPATLNEAGLRFNREGALDVDSARLDAALANPSALATLFGNGGLAERIRNFARDTLAAGGSATSRVNSLQETVKRKNQEIDRINERVQRTEAALRAQYTALDTKMAGYSSLSNYISQQLAAWSSPKR
ncbi:MAG: flagellar filament capping protein FliD [Tepidimonas ignava]